jgi:hypothetical protein
MKGWWRLSASSTPVRFAFGASRARAAPECACCCSTLECALGMVGVVLTAALAHWSGWLVPVAVLLYLLIVIPIALLCGFWQAVIVSLTAVVAQSYLNAGAPAVEPGGGPGELGDAAGVCAGGAGGEPAFFAGDGACAGG